MASTISDLVNYTQSDFPQLNADQQRWFSNEFRKIRNAINSIETIMRAGSIGVTPKAGLPATADLSAGEAGLFKDTSGGGVYLAYNDGGTIKKVALT